MRIFFLITFLIGLLLGVRAMLVGIIRSQEQLRKAPVLNLPTIGALLAVLGASGYLFDRYSTLAPWLAFAIAVLLGVGAAVGTFSLIAGWAVPSAVRDPEDPRFALQGHPGTLVQPITASAPGLIEFELDGRVQRLLARSLSGDDVAEGAEIVIERVEDGVAHVELWSVIERQIR